MFGILFMLEALIREIKKQLGDETKVVATGGLAKKIAKRSNSINFIDPYLSLDGIASIYYMNTDPN